MRVVILAVFCCLLLVSCDNTINHSTYLSKQKYTHQPSLIDSLTFFYSDTFYLTRVGNMVKIGDNIIVSDFYQKYIFIFDERLQLIKRIAGNGRGPGEYTHWPILFKDKHLCVYNTVSKNIIYYDKYYNIVKTDKLPLKYIYLPYFPISLNDKIIFNVGYPSVSIANESYYSNYKPLLALDKNLEASVEFGIWDENFFNDELDAYSKESKFVLLCSGGQNTFYELQGPTYYINHWDSELNMIKRFGTRPKFYKTPVKGVKLSQTQQNVESNVKFLSSITRNRKIEYDPECNLLFVAYTNLAEDFYSKKSLLVGKHYLQIYDKNYDCIYDNEVPGLLSFVDKGNVFILTNEKDEYLRIKVYKVNELP